MQKLKKGQNLDYLAVCQQILSTGPVIVLVFCPVVFYFFFLRDQKNCKINKNTIIIWKSMEIFDFIKENKNWSINAWYVLGDHDKLKQPYFRQVCKLKPSGRDIARQCNITARICKNRF